MVRDLLSSLHPQLRAALATIAACICAGYELTADGGPSPVVLSGVLAAYALGHWLVERVLLADRDGDGVPDVLQRHWPKLAPVLRVAAEEGWIDDALQQLRRMRRDRTGAYPMVPPIVLVLGLAGAASGCGAVQDVRLDEVLCQVVYEGVRVQVLDGVVCVDGLPGFGARLCVPLEAR